MKCYSLIVAAALCLALVNADENSKKVGEPNFQLQGGAAGNNLKNFGGAFNAGVGTKVWQNKDKSLELGVNYGRGFARVDGHTFKSKPVYGVGATFRWGKK